MPIALAHGLLVSLGLVLMSGPAAAHHGDAGRYDDSLTTVSGRVLELQLVSPHSFLLLEVAEPNGSTTRWMGELGRPANLRDWCWSEDRIQAGDRLTMVGRRRKNGQPYISLSEESRVLDANGTEIFRGNEPGQQREPGPCAQR